MVDSDVAKGAEYKTPFSAMEKGFYIVLYQQIHSIIPVLASMALPSYDLVPGYTLRQTKRQLVKFIPAAVSGRLTRKDQPPAPQRS